MKHTKGPWKVTRVWDEDIDQVDETLYKLENVKELESLANALLIAAAPELLEGLKGTLEILSNPDVAREAFNNKVVWECFLNDINKLINKAEGKE